jgi:hypothetical protein
MDGVVKCSDYHTGWYLIGRRKVEWRWMTCLFSGYICRLDVDQKPSHSRNGDMVRSGQERRYKTSECGLLCADKRTNRREIALSQICRVVKKNKDKLGLYYVG